MDNGLLFEAYGAIWKNTRGGSKEGKKEDIGRCSWLAQAEGWVERQRQRKWVGGRTKIRETSVCKGEKQMPCFSYLEKCCLFTNKNESKFL